MQLKDESTIIEEGINEKSTMVHLKENSLNNENKSKCQRKEYKLKYLKFKNIVYNLKQQP